MASINPYLHFNGNTEEAFSFYKSVFGGDFLILQRYKDVPADVPSHETEGDKIMHVSLPIGKGTVLMGSDRPASYGAATKGDNFYISIQTESEEETKKIFQALAISGQVTMPLEKTFWGALFGMITDKFGIQWMVNYYYNQDK